MDIYAGPSTGLSPTCLTAMTPSSCSVLMAISTCSPSSEPSVMAPEGRGVGGRANWCDKGGFPCLSRWQSGPSIPHDI